MFKIIRPNLIVVVLDVIHDMNNIRRSLLGLDRGTPNIPKKIKELVKKKINIGSEAELIFPINFSIIKKPVTVKVGDYKRTSNKGVGAMVLYQYLGKIDEIEHVLEIMMEFFKNMIENPPSERNWLAFLKNFKIIVGKDIKEISGEN